MKVKITKKIDEISSTSGLTGGNAGVPIGTKKIMRDFNEKEAADQRLKGKSLVEEEKLDEMYSTATSRGSGVLDPRLYDEYPGQKERADMQGLRNFLENKTKKIRIKIKKNISKKKT